MKSKLGPWLVMAAIFLAGALSGAALTMALGPRPGDRPPGPAQMRAHWKDRLSQRLKLTPDQQEKLQPILDDAGTKIEALHRDEVDRGAEIIKATDEKIATLLTPEQNAELTKMQAEREKMFNGHMRPWGGLGMHHHEGPDDGPPPPPPPPPTPDAEKAK